MDNDKHGHKLESHKMNHHHMCCNVDGMKIAPKRGFPQRLDNSRQIKRYAPHHLLRVSC